MNGDILDELMPDDGEEEAEGCLDILKTMLAAFTIGFIAFVAIMVIFVVWWFG